MSPLESDFFDSVSDVLCDFEPIAPFSLAWPPEDSFESVSETWVRPEEFSSSASFSTFPSSEIKSHQNF